MKISAYGIAMGVKQRRYPYEACIRSLATFCDEIIVAYDRRFDNPVIFSRLSEKVKLVEISYEFDKFDFVNMVLTQARRACTGEWCYIYGMDEVFHEHQTINLINAVNSANPDWNAITVRILCMVLFDYIHVGYFKQGQSRIGLTRNRPELRHGTAEYQTKTMDSPWWDGKYINPEFDDFSYYDDIKNTAYYGAEGRYFVEEAYDVPDDIKGDVAKEIKYKVENYTHIWHYAFYHIGRKEKQGAQTQIWQDRTYGRSPDLDIEKQVQILKETIILDPDRTKAIMDGVKQNPEYIQIDLTHPFLVQGWLEEMTIDAI